MICKILGLFVNTLTADDKYSVPNRDNLMEPIHIKLSGKEKAFPQFFFAFSEARLNFEHLKKNYNPYS